MTVRSAESARPDPTERFDVIVVGVGAVGACTCRALARRGVRVLGLDRFSIPNNQASYHGESRVFRTAYYEHESYVPLLQRARQLWFELQDEVGETLYIETGGLYMGRPDSEFIKGSQRALETHCLDYQSLDRMALADRYAQWSLPDDFIGIVEPHAGALFSERIVQAAARSAQLHGAVLHEQEPVQQWRATATGVVVETEQGKYTADRLVLCAGAWMGPIVGAIGTQLQVTRQVLAWFEPADAQPFSPQRFPIWGLDAGDAPFHYGFPILPGHEGLKVAHHTAGPPTTPKTIDRTPSEVDITSIRQAVAQFLPSGGDQIQRASVCMYTNSPDGHFIVDQHPTSDRVMYCAGLSGHGFKFAAVLGEALADLATGGETDLPVDFLSAARFG